MPFNAFDQEIGLPLPDFTAGSLPDVAVLEGKFCSVEHLDPDRHFTDIFEFYAAQAREADWTYLPVPPYKTETEVRALLERNASTQNPYYFAIRDKATDKVIGTFSLMNINPAARSIEMGYIIYSPSMQRSRVATEAQYLVMQYVFETLQYRRYEWKCDSLNKRSGRAAQRLGFTYEGTFRNNVVYKGRSRDTNWYAILDSEWPRQKAKFQTWLADANFDDSGQQRRSLQDC